jgi:hypothetical protein
MEEEEEEEEEGRRHHFSLLTESAGVNGPSTERSPSSRPCHGNDVVAAVMNDALHSDHPRIHCLAW